MIMEIGVTTVNQTQTNILIIFNINETKILNHHINQTTINKLQ